MTRESVSGPARVRLFAVAAGVFVVTDALWLGVIAPRFYRATIGGLLREQPDLLAAALFYTLFVIGVCEFVVIPAPAAAAFASVFGRGALFGLVAYATFDLTAMAVLRDWSWLVTGVDLAWGMLLTGTVAAVTHRLTRRGQPLSATLSRPRAR